MPIITIDAKDKRKNIKIFAKCGKSFYTCLIESGLHIPGGCGGNGSCKKCKVQFLEGVPQPCNTEKEALTTDELADNCRLLCCHKVVEDCKIKLPDTTYMKMGDAPNMEIIGMEQSVSLQTNGSAFKNEESPQMVAAVIDIGTTTIAAAFMDLKTNNILEILTTVNSQSIYGQDVLNRIKSANEGQSDAIKACIWNDLLTVCRKFLLRREEVIISQMILSGNTVMQHLLMGYPCKGLGEAPFKAFDLKLQKLSLGEITELAQGQENKIVVTLLPGISAFVGADIVSGLFSCEVDQKEKPILFVDLGTNGEIVLGNKEKLLATATAAGPAFEGANIKYGVPSINGSIQKVNMIADRLHISTIANENPIGLCGTGVLELTYELYKAGIMDQSGTLKEPYVNTGFPVVKRADGGMILYEQQDIRQFQMAKAAIRSGIDILIKQYNIKEDEIAEVCLAGGFGYKLNVYKAAGIGLLPQKLKGRARAVGNTSLMGAVKYLKVENSRQRMEKIIAVSTEINLAMQAEFQELYVKNMSF